MVPSLNFCSSQTFHDNAVSHEPEINEHENTQNLTTLCREYYSKRSHWKNILQGSSWIRPEDIQKHSEFFQGHYKLATRMHSNPRLVIHAYAEGRHWGNLLDLTEPGFGEIFYPEIIDNTLFPENWFEKITRCNAEKCQECSFCEEVLDKVLKNVEQETKFPALALA